jgi:hypothetical protein
MERRLDRSKEVDSIAADKALNLFLSFFFFFFGFPVGGSSFSVNMETESSSDVAFFFFFLEDFELLLVTVETTDAEAIDKILELRLDFRFSFVLAVSAISAPTIEFALGDDDLLPDDESFFFSFFSFLSAVFSSVSLFFFSFSLFLTAVIRVSPGSSGGITPLFSKVHI